MKHDLYCPICHRYHGSEKQCRRPQPFAAVRAVFTLLDMCGDCEYLPCRCTIPADLDLAWLPALADHDTIAEPRPLELAA